LYFIKPVTKVSVTSVSSLLYFMKPLSNKHIFYLIDHLHCYSCQWLCRYGPNALLCPPRGEGGQ
jgi:hypothetical protein